MNFFKSVFSDESEDSSSSNPPTEFSEPIPSSQSSNPNPSADGSSITGAWNFGSSLFKTLASKSESVIENYRRELEEFGSGLKKETAVIRQVASRAVKDLPASLDAGAEVAQRSLESVGGAVDNLGSAVTRIIITHGKGSFFADESYSENADVKYSSTIGENSKPYSRIDAQINALQREMNTYCDEPVDLNEYNQWKLGFMLEEKANEIDNLMEENSVVKEIYNKIVPNEIDHEIFWSRYFYKVYKIKKAEEMRSQLVKRAISGEDEELKWDIDEDDYEEYDESKSSSKLSGGVMEVKAADKGCSSDGNDNGGSSKDSDFSIISSQNSPKEEEEIGWDEIEDIGECDECKLDVADLRRRIRVAEEESEDLTWDVEDDDDHNS